jgi:hypothetical protein
MQSEHGKKFLFAIQPFFSFFHGRDGGGRLKVGRFRRGWPPPTKGTRPSEATVEEQQQTML